MSNCSYPKDAEVGPNGNEPGDAERNAKVLRAEELSLPQVKGELGACLKVQ